MASFRERKGRERHGEGPPPGQGRADPGRAALRHHRPFPPGDGPALQRHRPGPGPHRHPLPPALRPPPGKGPGHRRHPAEAPLAHPLRRPHRLQLDPALRVLPLYHGGHRHPLLLYGPRHRDPGLPLASERASDPPPGALRRRRGPGHGPGLRRFDGEPGRRSSGRPLRPGCRRALRLRGSREPAPPGYGRPGEDRGPAGSRRPDPPALRPGDGGPLRPDLERAFFSC